MLQDDRKKLSEYRMEKAKEDLESARLNLQSNLFKASINRSYYAIFHAMRAVNILDGFDTSKHSGVRAHFNQYYVHTGEFERSTYKIIEQAYRIRENADYSDFFVVTVKDAEDQFKIAEVFLNTISAYLEGIFSKTES